SGAHYQFTFNANGDGTFEIVDANGNSRTVTEMTHASPYFHKGDGVTNALVVEVHGQTIRTFVNSYVYGQFTDSTYTNGLLGFNVASGPNAAAEAVFTNLYVWALQ